MSPEHQDPTPAAPPPAPAPAPVPPAATPAPPAVAKPAAELRQPGRVLTWVALLMAAVALLTTGLMWQKLGFTQQELARRSQDTGAQAVEARTLAAQAEALTQELQARLAVAELRLSEVSLQRSQLEELMLSLSRSRDDNLVEDLESALRLAQQQAQLTGSAQPLVSALQAADQRISRAAQPRLNPVQRAITRDIQRIQGASLADIPSLVLQLDDLARQVDEWPLLNQVGQPVAPGAKGKKNKPAAPAATETAKAEAPEADTDTAETGSGFSAAWDRLASGWGALWDRIWADVSRNGRELVRVSRIDRPEAVLIAPDQALFMRENLKLKLLNARLGLLARHMQASQADIVAVEGALARYFDSTAPRVAAAQTALARLRKDLENSALPRPDETLTALTAAAGGR
ncbi:uroporphyrinogen-III C-methyltransferase [Hydrogenophaga palleronii]|uniref:uroporphyrinogen-III C-methyltransferase n=1 Tax=Hydrogenophaga palleronii TaxID=65655 RepID=UPI0009FFE2A7|nr:uroporphyrinogen-III C-methyltransferase [Hydrogenophaga palleronii]